MNGFHLRLEKAPAFSPPKYIPWSKRKHAIAKETASGQEHVRMADFSLRVFLLNLFSLSDTEGESSWTHSHSLQAWPSVMEPHLQGQPTKPGLGAVTCPRAKAPWASPFPFAALPGLTDNLNTGPWASTARLGMSFDPWWSFLGFVLHLENSTWWGVIPTNSHSPGIECFLQCS